MLEKIMNELTKRLDANGGECVITMKSTGKKLWIYRNETEYRVEFNDGNIWNTNKSQVLIFPFRENGLKKLADYIDHLTY